MLQKLSNLQIFYQRLTISTSEKMLFWTLEQIFKPARARHILEIIFFEKYGPSAFTEKKLSL